MDLEMLRELQQRGRFFYEMFPGAKASEEWQRHRDQLEREHEHRSRPVTIVEDVLPPRFVEWVNR